jgi:hypothetical protein
MAPSVMLKASETPMASTRMFRTLPIVPPRRQMICRFRPAQRGGHWRLPTTAY